MFDDFQRAVYSAVESLTTSFTLALSITLFLLFSSVVFFLTCSFKQMLKACIKEHFMRVFLLPLYPLHLFTLSHWTGGHQTSPYMWTSPTNPGKNEFQTLDTVSQLGTGFALCGARNRAQISGEFHRFFHLSCQQAPSSFPQYVVVVCYLSQALSDHPSYIHTDTPLCYPLTPSCPRPWNPFR